MGAAEILGIVELALKFGVPAVADAIEAAKKSGSPNPTVAEIRGILEGVEPPKDFS
jgi:hypothetical protein